MWTFLEIYTMIIYKRTVTRNVPEVILMTKSKIAAKGVLLAAAKLAVLALLAAFLISLTTKNQTSSADFSDVSKAVLAAADLSPMLEGDNQMIRRIYGLDPGMFQGAMLYYPSGNMGCEELLLIRLSDLGQQEMVQNAMRSRIASQRSAFDGYAPEQCDMLDRGIVEVRGNYLLLVVAEDPEPVRNAFLEAL